ncbi:hypothetical protein GGI20_000913 [Coemansia sp. BCRC 34301]|nr:hypothetical protein GGI20_000913 [Coemansia sp. BCRC 34301]
MSVDTAAKRLAGAINDDIPKQRKRSRTGGSKDLYDGHSQDVMLAKTLIDPDHQCSVTTVKAYVTHVCAWFRYCRTLAEPNYTLVDEAKLSGFLQWATQTPRLPCKTGSVGSGGSMSYQSARRYVEGGILALWRRYRSPDDENPLHALGYLNTKYAIREATAGERPLRQAERSYSALLVGADQEESIVRALLSGSHDSAASIRAWAFYCLGAATWIPGTRRLHLRLDSLVMAQRTDARLVEHTTVPFLEFRVSPDPGAATARFAEVSVARHVNPLVCPWYAVALLVFQQWQAQPSAMAAASLYDLSAWMRQPLFLADTEDSLLFLPDDTRVQMVMDEITPLLAHATAPVSAAPDSHVLRRRDKLLAEMLGLSAAQVVRLEKWRVHHRRPGVTRQQTFFDLTLVLGGHTPPDHAPHAFRAPPRSRLQVPDHLLAQVYPWLNACPASTPKHFAPRQRSHSMSAAANSEDVARAERCASLRLMRELATVLLQDTAALMAVPQNAQLLEDHPLFQHPLFASRAFRDFCAYAQQALALQPADIHLMLPPAEPPQPPPASIHHHHHHLSAFPKLHHNHHIAPLPIGRSRRHTFETIGEEDPVALAHATSAVFSPPHAQPPPPLMPHFNPMLLSQPLAFPPAAATTSAPAIAFPQLAEEPEPDQTSAEPMSQQYFMQIIDYLSVYNQQQQQQQQQQNPGFFHQPSMLPTVSSQSLLDSATMAAHQAAAAAAAATAAANSVATHFPRLPSESSETTASPEPTTTSTTATSNHQHIFTKLPAHGSSAVYHQHRASFTTQPSLLLAPAALTAAAAMAMSTAQNTGPLPLADQNSLSLYFSNAVATPTTASIATSHHHQHHDFIDPTSTLVNSNSAVTASQPHQQMLMLPKGLHASSSSSSLLSSQSSPTPTPPTSESSPAFHVQFKTDHELYLQ